MPSLLKTAFLELSKWAGNEYPKREDFVSDNEKIDAFADDISSQMAQIKQDFENVPAFNSLPLPSGFSAGSILYRKNKTGLVEVRVALNKETDFIANTPIVLGNLPVGFRPVQDVRQLISIMHTDFGYRGTTNAVLSVRSSGEINILTMVGVTYTGARNLTGTNFVFLALN